MKNKILVSIYVAILDTIRSSRILTFVIFKIKVRRKILNLSWDLTTVVLKKAIDKHLFDDRKDVLDMGCGHLAIISQYIKKKMHAINVTGVDIYRDLADNAAFNVKENGLDIPILCSDLYENITGKYDYIIFNPPYIPIDSKELPYPKTGYSGPDGTETIRKFLNESKLHLKENGRIILGINCFYVPYENVINIINEYGYKVEDVVSRRANTSKVFVMKAIIE